ncbi:hypothetical protein D3C81_1431940 [compost metagenome]
MAHPVTAFQRSATLICSAIPPDRVIFRPEKSSLRKFSLLHRATNKVFKPTKPLNFHLPSSLTIAGKSRGLLIRMLWLPISIIAMQ